MQDRDDDQPLLPSTVRLPNVGLLLELGHQRRRDIARLKRGDGPLAHQIEAAVRESRADLGVDADQEIVPVVLLYRQAERDYVVMTVQV